MRKFGSKYQTTGDVTKLDGTPLPEDEPLFLFRSQDKLLILVLEHYLELCRSAGSPETNLTPLMQTIEIVKAWQAAHQANLKTPD